MRFHVFIKFRCDPLSFRRHVDQIIQQFQSFTWDCTIYVCCDQEKGALLPRTNSVTLNVHDTLRNYVQQWTINREPLQLEITEFLVSLHLEVCQSVDVNSLFHRCFYGGNRLVALHTVIKLWYALQAERRERTALEVARLHCASESYNSLESTTDALVSRLRAAERVQYIQATKWIEEAKRNKDEAAAMLNRTNDALEVTQQRVRKIKPPVERTMTVLQIQSQQVRLPMITEQYCPISYYF